MKTDLMELHCNELASAALAAVVGGATPADDPRAAALQRMCESLRGLGGAYQLQTDAVSAAYASQPAKDWRRKDAREVRRAIRENRHNAKALGALADGCFGAVAQHRSGSPE
jgi:hypothetical protein